MSAWRRPLAVFIGGIAGGGARIGLSAAFAAPSGIPWDTLVANLSGALLLGYVLTRLLAGARRTTLTVPLLCTGVLGSYTTFSALSLETWMLLRGDRPALGVGYAVASVILGLAAAAAGIRLAERTP
ncbi:MAG: CrcB family protein [Actinobacteria bacterium]|nr:CrcB family protein [Actinomycetota bacterium]